MIEPLPGVSDIEVTEGENGLTLQWSRVGASSIRRTGRMFSAVIYWGYCFLFIFTGFVVSVLTTLSLASKIGTWGLGSFLWVVFAWDRWFWITGGTPVALTLGTTTLRYDPTSDRRSRRYARRIGILDGREPSWRLLTAIRIPRIVDLELNQISDFRIIWDGKAQRLLCDSSQGQLEIGDSLLGNDREWLLRVLKEWHRPHQHLPDSRD